MADKQNKPIQRRGVHRFEDSVHNEIDMDEVQKRVDIDDILTWVELIEKSQETIAWHTAKIKKIAKRWKEEKT